MTREQYEQQILNLLFEREFLAKKEKEHWESLDNIKQRIEEIDQEMITLARQLKSCGG